MSSSPGWSMQLSGEPWAKKRPRISAAVSGKARRTHQPADDRKAEEATRAEIARQWWELGFVRPLSGNVRLSAVFYRSTRGTVDLDNLLKHVLDAATGVLWVDDCQVTAYGVVELHLDRSNPRTEIAVQAHDTATMLRDYDPATGRVRV